MSTGWDRFAKVVAFVGAIVSLTVNGPKFVEALSALPSLVWLGGQGCCNIIALVFVAEASLDCAIAARQGQTPVSSAMKIVAVFLPLLAVFVISDICPRLGFAILKALGCA